MKVLHFDGDGLVLWSKHVDPDQAGLFIDGEHAAELEVTAEADAAAT